MANPIIAAGLGLAVLLLAPTSADVLAQDANEDPRHAADPNGMIRLSFPANVELRLLVDFVSQRLGINILYDEQVTNKRVTLKTPEQVPASSLLGILESALQLKGLMLVDDEQPGFKRIVVATNLIQVSRLPAEGDQAKPTEAVTQLFRLQHVTPQQVEPLVRPFLTQPGGNALSIPGQNVLIVTDYASNMPRITPLVEFADQPRPDVAVRFVPVAHAEPERLAAQLREILTAKTKAADAGRGGAGAAAELQIVAAERTSQLVLVGTPEQVTAAAGLIASLDVELPLETRVYRLAAISPQRIDQLAKELVPPAKRERLYRSAIDTEGNLLIVTTTAAFHEQLATLQRDLDKALPQAQSPVRFYKLMNALASNVLQTIRAIEGGTDLASVEVEGLSAAGAASAPAASEKVQLPQATGEGVTPVQELQATSKPRSAQDAAPSTTLQAVRTRSATVTADVGTNSIIVVAAPDVQTVYAELIRKLDQRRPQVLIEATLVALDTSEGFSLGVEVSTNTGQGPYINFSSFGLSEVDAGTGALTLVPGMGYNAVLMPSEHVQVIIRALSSSGRGRVLSSPKVLVNDNATGILSSVNEAPFTSVNASDSVATTSFAGFVEAGTTVEVTPHISEGDHLNLEYKIALNSFTGEGSAGVPPPRQTNTISSQVTVPDGQTIILGGLKRKDESETYNRVPILGDIPILGNLFGSTNKNAVETTLFVFLRPVILRDDKFSELKYLSSVETTAAGVADEYPESEPLWIR